VLKTSYTLKPLNLSTPTSRLCRDEVGFLISGLAMLRGVVRSRAALHLEVLALRHQLLVLQRSQPRRLRHPKADRWLWAWLSRVWSGWRTTIVIVMPETVVAWHRKGFRLFWTWKSRRTGRPPVAPDMRALIRQMAEDKPLGARHGYTASS
jgi:putative transposase